MKRRLSLGCALLVCLTWMPAQAQVLYDAFSGNHIDPAKWIATPMCVASGHDCAREVRNGHLRLAVRGYGATTHSSGVAVAESQLLFANPEAIETIQFRFTVTSSSSKACPANAEAAHPQLLLQAAFFKGAVEDVHAFLIVERRTDGDPPLPVNLLQVSGFTAGTAEPAHVDLGTVKVGEPAVATLKLDRTTKTFVWRVVKTFTSPHVAEAVVPYVEGDTTPPEAPLKTLGVLGFAPNCEAAQSFAAMDANIDNVRVNP